MSERERDFLHVSIRQHTSAYVSIHQHTSAYVRIVRERETSCTHKIKTLAQLAVTNLLDALAKG